MPCLFVDRVEKYNGYISVSTLTSKNISVTLVAVCLNLNIFFLPFSGLLTWKCIEYTYLVAVYTQNTASPFITAENVSFTFHADLWRSEDKLYLFFISKPLNRLPVLFCCLFASKYIISAVLLSLTCNCITGTYLVLIFISENIICTLLLAFWQLLTFFTAYFEVF